MKREPPDVEKIAIAQVKKLRLAKGMTQEKLAERADLTAEAVTRVERGVRMPTLRTLGKLAHGLGVSPSSLLETKELPAPTMSRHLAQIVAKLDDEDERVQEGALEVLAAYLRALRPFLPATIKKVRKKAKT